MFNTKTSFLHVICNILLKGQDYTLEFDTANTFIIFTFSAPSSPVHNRRLLSAKNIRMSSVELPDDNEKSPSSASTSPCPSPVAGKVRMLRNLAKLQLI